MRDLRLLWTGAVLLLAAATAQAGMIIHFDQDMYNLTLGVPFTASVILDADDATAGDQVLAEGLFSMSFELLYDSAFATVTGIDQVDIPSSLQNFGAASTPEITLGDGFVRVRANISVTAGPLYFGEDIGGSTVMRLATISITPTAVGMFGLNLGLFEPLGPSQAAFVDGARNVLDDEIAFVPAEAEVVPEPTSLLALMVIFSSALLGRRRNRGRGLIQ